MRPAYKLVYSCYATLVNVNCSHPGGKLRQSRRRQTRARIRNYTDCLAVTCKKQSYQGHEKVTRTSKAFEIIDCLSERNEQVVN